MVLEKKLNAKNIDYVENTDVDLMIDKGIMAVPVLEVDEKRLNFKEANEWLNNYNK
jgi:hypothetical protein